MTREAIFSDPNFPQRPRVSPNNNVIESMRVSVEKARQEVANLPPDASKVQKFLAQSKLGWVERMSSVIQSHSESEARSLEGEREYLLEHLEDTLKMLSSLEKEMGMKSKDRKVVEGGNFN